MRTANAVKHLSRFGDVKGPVGGRRVYHVEYDAPNVAGECDNEGAELYQREDDREETIRHRLKVYREQTAPLVEYYSGEGLLATISATGPVAEVTARAKSAIAEKRSAA